MTNGINNGYYYVRVTSKKLFLPESLLMPYACSQTTLQKNEIKVNEYGCVIGNRNFGIALFQRLKVF